MGPQGGGGRFFTYIEKYIEKIVYVLFNHNMLRYIARYFEFKAVMLI